MNGKMKNLKLVALLSTLTIAFAGLGFAKVMPLNGNVADGNSIVAMAATQNVATVNGVGYATLQEAIDNAQDGATVVFAADVTENVTITQKANVDIVIDGNNKNFTGVMTVFGNGRHNGAETLTIKNINFYAAAGKDSCILSPDKKVYNLYSYSHNVMVEDCQFYGVASDPYKAAAIRHNDGGDINWTIRNCLVDENMHSMLQVNNVEGALVVENCIVKSKNGFNLNSCTNVSISDCDVDVKGYAVRAGVKSGGNADASKTIVLKNNELKSECNDGDAVVMFRGASSSNTSLEMTENVVSGETHISGTTNEITVSANDNYWDGKSVPVVNGTKVEVDSYYTDENLTAVATGAARIGGTLYKTLQEAINNAQDGDMIVFAADVTENVTITQKENVNIVIHGNGNSFTGVMTVFGSHRPDGAEKLTIRNVDFYAVKGANSCIVSPSNNSYAHNVTVEGCKFYGVASDPYKAAAIRHQTGGDKNWTIKNCLIDENMHSLLQTKNVAGKLVIEGCTVNSKNGISLSCSTDVEISNCNINVKGYCVRAGEPAGGNPTEEKTLVLNNNKLKSEGDGGDAVVILRATMSNTSLEMSRNAVSGIGITHISGTTDEMTISANGNYWGGMSAPVVEGVEVSVDTYYADEKLHTLVNPNEIPDDNDDNNDNDNSDMYAGLDELIGIIGGLVGANGVVGSQDNVSTQNNVRTQTDDGIGAAGVIAIVLGSLAALIAIAAGVLWILEKKGIFKVTKFIEKIKNSLKK